VIRIKKPGCTVEGQSEVYKAGIEDHQSSSSAEQWPVMTLLENYERIRGDDVELQRPKFT
jgi:hypothetical protein